MCNESLSSIKYIILLYIHFTNLSTVHNVNFVNFGGHDYTIVTVVNAADYQ